MFGCNSLKDTHFNLFNYKGTENIKLALPKPVLSILYH